MDTPAPETHTDTVEATAGVVAKYTAVVTLGMIGFLMYVLYRIEMLGSASAAEGPEAGPLLPVYLLIGLMFIAGGIGGCLFNIHSLTKHVSRGDYKGENALSYFFNPVSGSVCGFIVIVLFLGGVLTLGLGEVAGDMVLDHPGRLMPFVGIAVIAGYGSRQFKLKLDELAETLFRTGGNGSPPHREPERAEPASPASRRPSRKKTSAKD